MTVNGAQVGEAIMSRSDIHGVPEAGVAATPAPGVPAPAPTGSPEVQIELLTAHITGLIHDLRVSYITLRPILDTERSRLLHYLRELQELDRKRFLTVINALGLPGNVMEEELLETYDARWPASLELSGPSQMPLEPAASSSAIVGDHVEDLGEAADVGTPPREEGVPSFVAELNDAELRLLRDALRQITRELKAAAALRRMLQDQTSVALEELATAS
jgi:hypothetical protein